MRSDLFIVAANPDHVPDAALRKPAEDLLWSYFRNAADGVDVSLHPKRRATGSTAAIEVLTCPQCATRLQVQADELEVWWDDLQGRIFNSSSPMTEVVEMPCCHARTTVGFINFGGKVRFSRLDIRVQDPADGEMLSAHQMTELESLLGCKLVQFLTFGT